MARLGTWHAKSDIPLRKRPHFCITVKIIWLQILNRERDCARGSELCKEVSVAINCQYEVIQPCANLQLTDPDHDRRTFQFPQDTCQIDWHHPRRL